MDPRSVKKRKYRGYFANLIPNWNKLHWAKFCKNLGLRKNRKLRATPVTTRKALFYLSLQTFV